VALKKLITGLLLLEFLLLSAGYLLTSFTTVKLLFSGIIILSLCYTAISAISLTVFCRGLNREPGSQTMHILVAIVVKMLLEMVLALILFVVAKKTDPATLILFFVLYLAFSLYSIIFMLKSLKSKAI